MAGTSEVGIFERDGQYLTGTVEGAAIVLGTVVDIGAADGGVATSGAASTKPLGVAIAGYRTSRIATDNQVAVGNPVTVCTRGVVNVTVAAAGAATRGEYAQTGAAGTVNNLTVAAAGDVNKILGIFLTSAVAGAVAKVKLLRG